MTMRMKEKKGCCDKHGVREGGRAWTPEEDKILVDYITKNGHATWKSLPELAVRTQKQPLAFQCNGKVFTLCPCGPNYFLDPRIVGDLVTPGCQFFITGILRCGKSCRLRWNNYLRPDIKRSAFTTEEEQLIIKHQAILGNKWAAIASKLPGRTDNDIKNLWNTRLKKRFPSTELNIVASAVPSMNQSTFWQPPSQLTSKSTVATSQSPSTPHMAEWEGVRVQAETRLSMDPLLLNPTVTVKTECNYYLQLWNSEVGDSFRMIMKEDEVESGSGITMQEGPALTFTSEYASDEQSSKAFFSNKMDYSDYSNSFQMEDSSDSALNLLLDFPSGGDYMEFLKQETGDFCSFLQE